ncbi:M16 family metallopeptidase, partial [Pseudomonas canadensis]|uniref:M16 family metallopeptidase n=1 Tax=Pseudomonas canadensis TaxID=915099 RepID=UPI0030DBC756
AIKNPSQLAGLVAARAALGDTEYGHPLSGTPNSLKAITQADIRRAYAEAWAPGRSTLVLVGDVTTAQAKTLAESNFANWTAPAAPPEAVTPVAAYPKPRVIVVDMPGSGQAGVVVARPGLARTDAAYYPAAVANTVLGGGFSSRLNQ